MSSKQAVGNLAIILSANASPMSQGFRQAENLTTQFARNQVRILDQHAPKLASAGEKAGKSFGETMGATAIKSFVGFFAVSKIAGFIKKGLDGVASTEMDTGALTSILGSNATATSLVRQFDKLGAQTGIDPGRYRRLAMEFANAGVEADQLVHWMREISNISQLAGGGDERLESIAGSIKTILEQEKFTSSSLKSLGGAGFPIQELAKTAKMSMPEFRKAIDDGTIGVEVLIQTMNRLEKEKNALANATDNYTTKLGRLSVAWSNFADSTAQSRLVKESIDVLTNSLTGMTAAIQGDEWKSANTELQTLIAGLASPLLVLPDVLHSDTAKSIIDHQTENYKGWKSLFDGRFMEAWRGSATDSMPIMEVSIDPKLHENSMWEAVRELNKELESTQIKVPVVAKFLKPDPDRQWAREMAAEINQQTEQWVGSPLQKIKREFRQIGMLERGGELTKLMAGQARLRLFSDLEKSIGSLETRLPRALAKGSAEAESIISAAMVSGKQDRQQRVERILESLGRELQRIESEQRQTNRILDSINFKKYGL